MIVPLNKTSSITTLQVCQAVFAANELRKENIHTYPYILLSQETGIPEKVCYSAMQRDYLKGFIEYGVSLRTGWLTEAGKALIGDFNINHIDRNKVKRMNV